MDFERGDIVLSRRGHDAGELFCVMDVQGDRVLLADGKRRRASAPKRKNVRHVEHAGSCGHPALEKVRAGEPIRDRELRALLAGFRDEMEV